MLFRSYMLTYDNSIEDKKFMAAVERENDYFVKLIEAHRDSADEAKRILQEEMERAVSYSVPLNVDIHVGNTWFDAK